MIFGKKSDVHKQISGKHSMYSHKLFVDEAPAATVEPMRCDELSAEKSPQSQVEQPEVTHLQS
jgi:hypothetical protein